jgi:hypothetical protein
MVIVPHSEKDCVTTLDDLSAQGSSTLSKFYFGCKNGDHTAYGLINASSESDVRNMLPANMKDKAKIMPVNQFTIDEIKAIHEKYKE